MANEKLQRYFNGIVKIISDACTKQVKTQLCKLDEKEFRSFESSFNHLTDTDCPTLYNFVQLFSLIENLKKIIQLSPTLAQIFAQHLINTQVFFKTIIETNSLVKTYVEALKKLYILEESADIELLSSLGSTFRKTIIDFQSLQSPTWDLLEQFKDALIKYNTTSASKIHFDPIITLIGSALPKLSQSAPILTPSFKASTTPAQ